MSIRNVHILMKKFWYQNQRIALASQRRRRQRHEVQPYKESDNKRNIKGQNKSCCTKRENGQKTSSSRAKYKIWQWKWKFAKQKGLWKDKTDMQDKRTARIVKQGAVQQRLFFRRCEPALSVQYAPPWNGQLYRPRVQKTSENKLCAWDWYYIMKGVLSGRQL